MFYVILEKKYSLYYRQEKCFCLFKIIMKYEYCIIVSRLTASAAINMQ